MEEVLDRLQRHGLVVRTGKRGMIEKAWPDIVPKPARTCPDCGAPEIDPSAGGVAVSAQIISDDEPAIGPTHEQRVAQMQALDDILDVVRPQFAARVSVAGEGSLGLAVSAN